MKKTVFLSSLIVVGAQAFAATDKPKEVVAEKAGEVEKLVVYNHNYFKGGQFQGSYLGKMAALEATIDKIEEGPLDQPIFHVTLTQGEKHSLWVASLVKITDDMVAVGSKVKILGMFDKTAEEPEYMAKLTEDKEYLLGFCFYDVNTGRPMYRPNLMKTCLDWEYGKKVDRLKP